MDATAFLTIVAIIVGPILAVAITRSQDRRREVRQKKLEILRALMKTRRLQLDPEHVSALNLIELDFYGRDAVIIPYKAYIVHLNSPLPRLAEQNRFFEERHSLFLSLLHALGHELGYKFDKHDLRHFGYTPTGWHDDQNRVRHNAALLTDILEGTRALPVTPMQPPKANPFPPTPHPDD
jgi:hypothetical protein